MLRRCSQHRGLNSSLSLAELQVSVANRSRRQNKDNSQLRLNRAAQARDVQKSRSPSESLIGRQFRGVISRLDVLQTDLESRRSSPEVTATHAQQLLVQECASDDFPELSRYLSAEDIGNFARRCAPLLAKATTPLPIKTANALKSFFGTHLKDSRSVSFQSSCGILQCALDVQEASSENRNKGSGPGLTVGQFGEPPSFSNEEEDVFKELIELAYNAAFTAWDSDIAESQVKIGRPEPMLESRDLVSLLRASHEVRSPKFQFQQVDDSSDSLLGRKPHDQMRTKVQKTGEAPRVIKALVSENCKSFNKGTAGSTLKLLAATGLHDADLIKKCCATLTQTISLMSPRQLAIIVHSLGTLSYTSHPLALAASKNMIFKKIQAKELLSFIQGCARGRIWFETAKTLTPVEVMDGVWLHTLRHAKKKQKVHEGAEYNRRERDAMVRATAVPIPAAEVVDFSWLVEMNHCLHHCGITHHKYLVYSARQLRPEIHKMSPEQWMKCLFAFGGKDTRETILTKELEETWQQKVVPFIKTVAGKMGEQGVIAHVFQAHGGNVSLVTARRALTHCGLVDHPLLTAQWNEDVRSETNPLRELCRLWEVLRPEKTVEYLHTIVTNPEHMRFDRKAIPELFSKLAGIDLGLFYEEHRQSLKSDYQELCHLVATTPDTLGALDIPSLRFLLISFGHCRLRGDVGEPSAIPTTRNASASHSGGEEGSVKILKLPRAIAVELQVRFSNDPADGGVWRAKELARSDEGFQQTLDHLWDIKVSLEALGLLKGAEMVTRGRQNLFRLASGRGSLERPEERKARSAASDTRVGEDAGGDQSHLPHELRRPKRSFQEPADTDDDDARDRDDMPF